MTTTAVLSTPPGAWLLPVTLISAALCAGLQLALTALVIARRRHSGVSFQDGGDTTLMRRMRAHGNLTETAPLALLLLGAVELAAAPRGVLVALASLLVVGRLLHAAGVLCHSDGWARRLGMAATMLALSALGATSLWFGVRGL